MIFKTQEQIVEEMLTDFATEIDNANISDASDIAIKAKVYAAQINGLYYNLEWLKTQLVPQTATGVFLDYHAEEKGVFRKQAEKATGTLQFSRNIVDTVDRQIPAGTECSTKPDKEGNAIKFVTLVDAVLLEGSLLVDVAAEAINEGIAGNVATNTITEMTAPPLGIDNVVNPLAFTGGSEKEDDDMLRERYLYACRNPENGGTKADYEKWAMSVSGVTSALCLPLNRGAGTTDIVIASNNGIPSQSTIDEVQSLIDSKRPIGCDAQAITPTTVSVDITLSVITQEGYQLADIQTNINENITNYINSIGLGGIVLINAIRNAIYDTEGIYDFELTAPITNIELESTELAVVGNITIS